MVNVDTIRELVEEVMSADPIPFSQVKMQESDVIDFLMNSVWEQYQTEWKLVDRDKTEELLLSAMIRLIAENFFLHTRHLMLVGHEVNDI